VAPLVASHRGAFPCANAVVRSRPGRKMLRLVWGKLVSAEVRFVT